MSNVQALNFKQQLAEAQAVAEQKKLALRDLSAADILSFRRELKAVSVDGLGTFYVYEPISVAERDAFQKHTRLDPITRLLHSTMRGIVDGIIARARNKNGVLLFSEVDQARLLEMPAERLLDIWNAIGGASAELSEAMVDAAEKK